MIEHSITPTVAEFRAQIEILNARIHTDALRSEQDQFAIDELKDLLFDARNRVNEWRSYAMRLEAITGPMPGGIARPE